jgi:preprotein translocase subunit Sec63
MNGQTATLEMGDLPVRDEPKFPALDAESTPATLSFKMVVKATDEKVVYDDSLKQFRVDGYHATAQMKAQVNVPSIGFSWKSDPVATSKASSAIIGDEVNGRY